MQERALVIENLSVSYGKKTVLKNISLEILEGEFWGIIGPNGGGKTTLLKAILGLVKPKEGKIKIFGLPPEEAVKKKLVGYLPQRVDSLLPLSSWDIVRLVAESEDAERLLKLVGMLEKKDIPFSKLSGGERQRVLIALALAGRPRLLLLDEPNTGIDIVAQDLFYELLRKIKEENKTAILMVSHDVGVITHFVDKIACLNRTLHYQGDPRGALDCRLLEELYGTKVEVLVHHPECKGCHIYPTS